MNTQRPAAGLRDDRDIDWMDKTYPLHEDWIQAAIDQLAAGNTQAKARHADRADGRRQQERGSESVAFYARVTGPVDGYYIASHACRASDTVGGAYTGAYKICNVAPSSYWTAQSVQFGSCKHTEATGLGAMASAEAAAALMIAQMPSRIDRA